MAPENARNRGKWRGWEQLGYDLDNGRQEAADDVLRQLLPQLPFAEVVERKSSRHGERHTTETPITGPNGRKGTMVCVWQYDHGSDTPRMLTNWVEVHTDKGAT